VTAFCQAIALAKGAGGGAMFHAGMHHYLERCLASLERATGGLSDAQGKAHPDGKWSVAEIVEHLDRTYSGTAKGFERCLAADRAQASRPTLNNRLRVAIVVGAGYYPPGRLAPRQVVPSGTLGLADALASARRSLRALDLAAIGASGRFGRARVLDHPVLGPLTVGQWRRFHWIHTRHHARQIEHRRKTF
jgi:hypothetical protein